MDLLWLLLFAALCVALGGLLLACDRWLTPRAPSRQPSAAGAGRMPARSAP